MKVVDIVFGKRVTGSLYHVQGTYMKRIACENKHALLPIVRDSLDEIMTQEEFTDEVMLILNKINAGVNTLIDRENEDENAEVIKHINTSFATLSYAGYEFYAIMRSDLEIENEEDFGMDLSDRTYALTKQFEEDKLFNINNFSYGISNTYDELTVNINSMVMDYLESNKIHIDDEFTEIVNLQDAIREYQLMNDRNESNYMDTTKELDYLEKLGYKFLIVFNMTDSNIEE